MYTQEIESVIINSSQLMHEEWEFGLYLSVGNYA